MQGVMFRRSLRYAVVPKYRFDDCWNLRVSIIRIIIMSEHSVLVTIGVAMADAGLYLYKLILWWKDIRQIK